ncbi:hypothetical protein E2C01_077202 [Portunus trituberculatus]|uniref:Uncharacterized protein n=1 Tax=Portunus trituberculatus TaxID=210409 RepID=A0A5B7IDS4_PORTR|nr:hypothetical protein [Portunus trituberculatus]
MWFRIFRDSRPHPAKGLPLWVTRHEVVILRDKNKTGGTRIVKLLWPVSLTSNAALHPHHHRGNTSGIARSPPPPREHKRRGKPAKHLASFPLLYEKKKTCTDARLKRIE